jgi:EGF-like domain
MIRSNLDVCGCRNGGQCVVPEEATTSTPFRCDCPQGFAGPLCEYDAITCDDPNSINLPRDGGSIICLHGSQCAVALEDDAAEGDHYYDRCVCATDNNNSNPSNASSSTTLAAASSTAPTASSSSSSCVSRPVEFCAPTRSTNAGQQEYLEYYGGMAVAAFCLNGGKCTDVVLDDHMYVEVWGRRTLDFWKWVKKQGDILIMTAMRACVWVCL